jgi:predicted dehydrogenase
MTKLNWGILGTGTAAKSFARGLQACRSGCAYAVASRSADRAKHLAAEFDFQAHYANYESLLDDPRVDAVYIATPHPQHVEWAIRAARHRKHLLVEKPLAVDLNGATCIANAAAENNVMLMEGFAFRCHPATAKLIELIQRGTIGEVRMIKATYSIDAAFDPKSRLFDKAYAGGAILDVGCYAVNVARLIAGAAQHRDFDDPIEVKGSAQIGHTGVDEWASATMKFPAGIIAQLSASIRLRQDNVVRIFGSNGNITREGSRPRIGSVGDITQIAVEQYDGNTVERHQVETALPLFSLEADAFASALAQGRREAIPPAPSIADSLGNMAALDRWRREVGV